MSENNPFPNENNTGHIWDDNLRELKNPPPRWWTIGFWISIIWWIIYSILYPMWPIGQNFTQGLLGWSQIKEYNKSVAEVASIRAPFEDKLKKMTPEQILKDDDMIAYVRASAKVLFGDHCSACHGNGGQGGPGYPVLIDDDWLYGGDINTIIQTITNGRQGMMPAHAKTINGRDVDSLVKAIMSRDPTSSSLYVQKGCIACHAADGKGMKILGSADLTDAIWRFFELNQSASVRSTILHGVNDFSDPLTREAIMPKFGQRLSKDEIKKIAVYVSTLGRSTQ